MDSGPNPSFGYSLLLSFSPPTVILPSPFLMPLPLSEETSPVFFCFFRMIMLLKVSLLSKAFKQSADNWKVQLDQLWLMWVVAFSFLAQRKILFFSFFFWVCWFHEAMEPIKRALTLYCRMLSISLFLSCDIFQFVYCFCIKVPAQALGKSILEKKNKKSEIKKCTSHLGQERSDLRRDP